VSPASQDRTLAQQLSGAFIFFGTLVASAFLLTALAYGVSRVWLAPELERSRLAAANERIADAAMLDEETGLRAYLMTRDVRFLDAYSRGQVALAKANDALTTSVGVDPQVAMAMVATRLAQERWRAGWAQAAAEIGHDRVAPSMIEGKTLFDAYRVAERTLAEALQHRSDALTTRNQRVVAVRVALELAVFIVILFFAMRQHRALHAAIVTPVAALLVHIRHIRDGQLEATADSVGPRELAELAVGLNEVVHALASARRLAKVGDEALREHSLRLRQILEASREFSESLNLTYVVTAVRESTVHVGGYARVVVWLMDDEQKNLVNAERTQKVVSSASAPIELGQGLAGRAAKSGRITFEGPKGQVHFSDSNIGPVCAIAVPLIVGARVVGVLEARHAEAKVATLGEIEILEMLATHAATAIESARLHEIIEERSHMDPLTRLFNRRRLEEDLEAECKRSGRYERPLSFVMLDVDHFKAFNDVHGHPQGDAALQGVADVIAGCVRTTDTAYRYGGEEFCVLLRETTARDGMLFAERVRQRVEHRFASGAAAGVTVSLGVAGFSAETPTPHGLVEAADAAMYESKHAGRNRVTLSEPPPPVPKKPSGQVEPFPS
jgi:diguanylate cyclase (GGDEF)-like protein